MEVENNNKIIVEFGPRTIIKEPQEENKNNHNHRHHQKHKLGNREIVNLN